MKHQNISVTGSLNLNGVGVATTSTLNAFTASSDTKVNALIANTGSYATTGSNTFTGSQIIQGTLTAQTLVVQTVTSSVLYTTGSNIIGSSLSNVQQITGSVGITGSLVVNGTGAIVGSGTANYVPKFTAGSTVGNSNLITDANGNVGVGVNPSAGWVQGKALEVGFVGSAIWGRYADEVHLTNNYYFSTATSSRLYASTAPASDYEQYNGTHVWYTAPSGTAGTALTFTERMRIANNGAATFSSGIGIGGATATTGGIQFPATQVAIADGNNLDDYEEGTWTAAFVPETGTITMDNSFKTGRYTKVGRLVSIVLHARFTAISSPTGSLQITGLPFTSASSNQNRTAGSIICFDTSAPANTSVVVYLGNNITSMVIAGFSQSLLNASSYIKATSEIYIGLSYIVD